MNVLIDTDVLIDLALDRVPHSDSAASLLDALERKRGKAFFAWHSASNFFYLVAPVRGNEEARGFLLDLARFAQIAPTTTNSLVYAGRLRMTDFEDAMQVAAAVACGAEFIATRNVRDYARSPVPAASPTSIVKALT